MISITGTIRTRHNEPACVAASLVPDNLRSMDTKAVEGYVETRITGTSVRSVIASMDDYLMNLAIADETCSSVSPVKDIRERENRNSN